MKSTPRFVAVEVLDAIEKRGSYSNIELDLAMKKHTFIPVDAGLLTELVYGVTQRKYTLDYYLEPYTEKMKRIDSWVLQLLRVSAYQLIYLDKIPSFAAVNEAVEIAKIRGNQGIAKFVNAVLRNLQRNDLRSIEDIQDIHQKLSIKYSAPVWLIEKFVKDIGLEETEKLFASLLEKSDVSLRVNEPLSNVDEAKALLEAEEVDARRSKVSPVGLVVKSGYLAGTDVFKSGKITIQDESSMLVAPALQIEANHKVLDACAAPGGKTTHIANYLSAEQGGIVTALDLHEKKLKFIHQNAKRMNLSDVIDTQALDARKVSEEFPAESFDRILVDAPCSGLGLMRRKPDIKYAKSEEDIQNLASIQLAILNAVSDTLKKDGILVYSTCTITKEENQEVVEAFLKQHPEFELIDVEAPLLNEENKQDKMVQIYPHDYHTDGFFIASLKKKPQTD